MARSERILTFDRHIRHRLLGHLNSLGFVQTADGGLCPPNESKTALRAMHRLQREERLLSEQQFVADAWLRLQHHFADGSDVTPSLISPRLELIEANSWQSDLFRLASLTWSVPVSQGYGRRMRFLVWDDSNGKLIGLIALGDPVFNMRVRDQAIGWDVRDREKRLVNVLDAYVLGAVPPYNMLLCGKLIAALLRTREIKRAFSKKYNAYRGVISEKRKHASLVLITTTSALGRSSVYNRLTLGGVKYLRPIGYTSGWGHFHIPADLFELIRKFLSARDHKYADNNRFGDGPNWKLRAVRQALSLLGMNQDLLRHGIQREVFLCQLAQNANGYLRGTAKSPRYSGLKPVREVAEMAKERWILPRAHRNPAFRFQQASELQQILEIPMKAARYGAR